LHSVRGNILLALLVRSSIPAADGGLFFDFLVLERKIHVQVITEGKAVVEASRDMHMYTVLGPLHVISPALAFFYDLLQSKHSGTLCSRRLSLPPKAPTLISNPPGDLPSGSSIPSDPAPTYPSTSSPKTLPPPTAIH